MKRCMSNSEYSSSLPILISSDNVLNKHKSSIFYRVYQYNMMLAHQFQNIDWLWKSYRLLQIYSNALSYQQSFLFPSEPIIFCVFACAIDLRWMLTSDWFPGTLWCFRYHMINYVQKHIHLPDEMLMSLQSTLFKWQATLHGPNKII